MFRINKLVYDSSYSITYSEISPSASPVNVIIDKHDYLGKKFVSLDLDADLDASVTVVEWGEGRAEGLAEEPLYVRITPEDVGDVRQLTLQGSGARWTAVVDALRGWSP
jgi:hypothetical protein